MQSSWASDNGSGNNGSHNNIGQHEQQQPSVPGWPEPFDFAVPHFDPAQWTDPALADVAFHELEGSDVSHHPGHHFQNPQAQQQQQHQEQQHPQHLQAQSLLQPHAEPQSSYGTGHQSAVAGQHAQAPGGFGVRGIYDASRFPFDPSLAHVTHTQTPPATTHPQGSQERQGFAPHGAAEFGRQNGQGYGHMTGQHHPAQVHQPRQLLSAPQGYGSDGGGVGGVGVGVGATGQTPQQQQQLQRNYQQQPASMPPPRPSDPPTSHTNAPYHASIHAVQQQPHQGSGRPESPSAGRLQGAQVARTVHNTQQQQQQARQASALQQQQQQQAQQASALQQQQHQQHQLAHHAAHQLGASSASQPDQRLLPGPRPSLQHPVLQPSQNPPPQVPPHAQPGSQSYSQPQVHSSQVQHYDPSRVHTPAQPDAPYPQPRHQHAPQTSNSPAPSALHPQLRTAAAVHGQPAPPSFQQPSPNPVTTQPLQPAVGAVPSPRSVPSIQPKTASPRPSVDPLEGPSSKRRKKAASAVTKKTPLIASVESTPDRSDAPVFAGAPPAPSKAVADVDSLSAPQPTPSDRALVAQSEKSKPHWTPLKGLPHLIAMGTVKLPAPKSHDKLLPVVAHPSRSGKAIVPEIDGDLPCEVQGRFAAAFAPDMSVPGGLDFRRAESAGLLQIFDADMAKLGRRRPKYTEYPQVFKEQIKTDEAVKSKVERKAKKEKETQLVRPEVRPDDPIEGASWDILGAVCLNPNVARSSKLIGEAVVQARDIFTSLRSKLTQAKQEVDQSVKDGVDAKQIATLRKQYETRQEALYRALDVCIEHGDDAVLENLGTHPRLVLTLVNILISCINSGDINGKIAKATLELMTHFSMTKQVAQQANFNSVRRRLADKGDAETKDLLKDVVAGIQDPTGSTKDSQTASPPPKAAKPAAKAVSSAAATVPPVKRGRDDDGEARTVKKIAVESSSSLSKKLGPQKFVLSSASKATPAAKTGATASSVAPASKTRPVAKPAPKAADLSAVDDESGRAPPKTEPPKQQAARPDAAKASSASRTPSAPSGSTSASAGGIASLLDMINAPKQERSSQRDTKAATTVTETSVEKVKRLRKEARRRLRVTWRPDDELEQVRIFHRDAHENEGRSANMTRDAADGRKEGMLLKQRKNQSFDEDDEDEDSDSEISSRPWFVPTSADTSAIPEEKRTSSFATRGGSISVDTDEQKSMAEREQRELMAIYTDPADIPATPKSPPPEPAPFVDAKTAQLPATFTEIHRRWGETTKFGHQSALYYATQRLEASETAKSGKEVARAPQAPRSPVVLPVGSIEEQVLYLLNLDRIRNWANDDTPATDALAGVGPADGFVSELASVIKVLSGKPYPPTQPPDWLADPDKVREWWVGYHRDSNKSRHGVSIPDVATVQPAQQPPPPPQPLQQQQQQPSWPAFPPMPPPGTLPQPHQQFAPYLAMLQPGQAYDQTPPSSFQPPPPPPAGVDFRALFSQLSQTGTAPTLPSTTPHMPVPPQYLNMNPNDPTFAQLAMLQHLVQSSAAPRTDSQRMDWEPDRDHDRERDSRRDRDPPSSSSARDTTRRIGTGTAPTTSGTGGGTTKKVTLPPHRPVNAALIGTKPCTFWRVGKCARGDSCTFRHD